MDLDIGKLDVQETARVARVLAERGGVFAGTWNNCREKIAWISILNLSSVCMFNDYAASLEGIRDSSNAMERTRFKSLPWWMYSYWLPIRLKAPVPPGDDWDFLLGSSYTLLDELTEIKAMSDIDLDQVPPGYQLMRSDPKAWFKSEFELENDDDIIRWVWRGLWDAAELSIKENAPIFGGD